MLWCRLRLVRGEAVGWCSGDRSSMSARHFTVLATERCLPVFLVQTSVLADGELLTLLPRRDQRTDSAGTDFAPLPVTHKRLVASNEHDCAFVPSRAPGLSSA